MTWKTTCCAQPAPGHHSVNCKLAPNKVIEDGDTQVQAPYCKHQWEEVDTDEDNTGIPPYDVCVQCGEERH